jgi:hypothetical protein
VEEGQPRKHIMFGLVYQRRWRNTVEGLNAEEMYDGMERGQKVGNIYIYGICTQKMSRWKIRD